MNKSRDGRGSCKFYRLRNKTEVANVAVASIKNGEDLFRKREGEFKMKPRFLTE